MVVIAVAQLCSTAFVQMNLEKCIRLIREAADGGAKVIFFPEASDYIATSTNESLLLAQSQEKSPFVLGVRQAARDHHVDVHIGIHVPAPGETSSRVLNRTLWIRGSDGEVLPGATYDKLHLFDYGRLRESASVRPGEKLVEPFDSPAGRIGSLICFDLRFPEPALKLTQRRPVMKDSNPDYDADDGVSAQLLTYPSAFTVRTGEAHWEVLLRARAIETQSWVVAAAQCGMHNGDRISYGHSMVVDPWGRVALDMGGFDGPPDDVENVVGFVDLDMAVLHQVRLEMPLVRRK